VQTRIGHKLLELFPKIN